MKDKKVVVGGEELDSCYGDYQAEVDMINRAFLELMVEGDHQGRVFTFPIPTYNLTRDFDWDSPNAKLLFEATAKYGIPYFQNYIGTNMNPGDIRAMCCRLNLDQRELMRRPGNIWGPGDSTGSIGVVTDQPQPHRLRGQDPKEEYKARLKELMVLAKESLETKREIVNNMLARGIMPYTQVYLGHFNNHFSTIGICGMHEACLNFLGQGHRHARGQGVRRRDPRSSCADVLRQFQEETGNLYNLEATPAESTSYRLARLDRQKYPNIVTSGTEKHPYLTNSTQLNVDATRDVFEALQHQEEIQTLYTGGTIFHTFLPEAIDGETCRKLVQKIAETASRISASPRRSASARTTATSGASSRPARSAATTTEVYRRIVGYLRPVRTWNDGKQQEFKDRTPVHGDRLTARPWTTCSSPTRTARSARTSRRPSAEKGIGLRSIQPGRGAGKAKIREFLPHVKRDDKGAIILPTLVLQDQGTSGPSSTPPRSSRSG